MTLTDYILIMSQEFNTSSKCNTSSRFCTLSIITQATIESTTPDMTIVSQIEIKHNVKKKKSVEQMKAPNFLKTILKIQFNLAKKGNLSILKDDSCQWQIYFDTPIYFQIISSYMNDQMKEVEFSQLWNQWATV